MCIYVVYLQYVVCTLPLSGYVYLNAYFLAPPSFWLGQVIFSQYLLKAVVWLLGYIVRCSLIASNLHFLLLSNSNALFRLIWHITVFSSEQFIMLVLLR